MPVPGLEGDEKLEISQPGMEGGHFEMDPDLRNIKDQIRNRVGADLKEPGIHS